jgi:hypothetical protein
MILFHSHWLVRIIPPITAGISEVARAPYPAYPLGTAYLAGHPRCHAPGYYPRVFPDIPGTGSSARLEP